MKTFALQVPAIHLNGTSKASILEAYEEAHAKIREAMTALTECAPNARDYYTKKDPHAFEQARAEYQARFQKLTDVRDELEWLATEVSIGGAR